MIQNKDILAISILTFITVISWIVFDVYHAAVTSQITEVQQQLMTPLTPQLNIAVLDALENRAQPSEQQ